MAEYSANNKQDIVKESLIYVISKKKKKKLAEIWENKPLKVTYGLLQFLFLVIDESNFWTSSDIVLPINLLSGLTEERVSNILQQPNNL